METHEGFLRQALELAAENVSRNGRPFGAVIVREGVVLATGVNELQSTGDPTTHAELQAIRGACRQAANPRLDGCVIYASGHPCPMCLSAIHLTGIQEVYYAYSLQEGEPYGLSSADIYDQMAKPTAQQRVRITHMPLRLDGDDLYARWFGDTTR